MSRYGNLYIRAHHFNKAGDKHKGHRHLVDHVTMLTRGSVRVQYKLPDGSENEGTYQAPYLIEIDKDIFHQLTALEDGTMYFCVFSIAGIADQSALASMQAGMCDACEDGSGCSPQMADMIAFGDGSRMST